MAASPNSLCSTVVRSTATSVVVEGSPVLLTQVECFANSCFCSCNHCYSSSKSTQYGTMTMVMNPQLAKEQALPSDVVEELHVSLYARLLAVSPYTSCSHSNSIIFFGKRFPCSTCRSKNLPLRGNDRSITGLLGNLVMNCLLLFGYRNW